MPDYSPATKPADSDGIGAVIIIHNYSKQHCASARAHANKTIGLHHPHPPAADADRRRAAGGERP